MHYAAGTLTARCSAVSPSRVRAKGRAPPLSSSSNMWCLDSLTACVQQPPVVGLVPLASGQVCKYVNALNRDLCVQPHFVARWQPGRVLTTRFGALQSHMGGTRPIRQIEPFKAQVTRKLRATAIKAGAERKPCAAGNLHHQNAWHWHLHRRH